MRKRRRELIHLFEGRTPWAMVGAGLVVALGSLGLTPSPSQGQDLPPTFGRFDPDPDFLFERPRVSIGVRGGMFFHRAGSDLYAFTEERFTVDRSDYRAPSLGAEAGLWLGPRWEINIALDGSEVSLDSEYRDLVEEDGSEDGLPIRQTTRVREGAVFSVGGRYYLFERGERVGQFVWLPRRWNAFVGGGAGITGYKLDLSGDFVDESDFSISTERFTSSGSAVFPFVSGGLERGLTDRTAIALDARYMWVDRPRLGRDFADYGPLDLDGFRITVGFFFRN